MILKYSRVDYDPVSHTYTLDGKQLSGITGVIKDKLFPDYYKDVPEDVLNKAAERGHRIHTAIELFDTCDIPTEDCDELKGYIEEIFSHDFIGRHMASEYVVSDNEKYASAIDKVYADGMGGVILADIKTTYKLNTDYVSWQLSVYAYFFSMLNPGIPVSGAYAIWLRHDKHKVVEVPLRPVEDVLKLLYGDEAPKTDCGFGELSFTEDYLLQLKNEAEEATAKYEQAKQEALALLTKKGMKNIRGSHLMITRRSDSERKTFDTKKFNTDHPELYAEYLKTAITKGGITVKAI